MPDDEDQLRAEPLRLMDRQDRLYAAGPGFVGRGRDDRPLPAARDRYGFALKLGVVPLLNGSKERVHVDARDYSGHA